MFYEQVKELAVEPFKRLTGVKSETFKVMVEALRRAEETKRKSGRPKKLSIENQVLMTLMYLRENRTSFHIGHAYGINASTCDYCLASTSSKNLTYVTPSKPLS